MKPVSIRGVAALLVIAVTACGLKGIATLARGSAELPTVTLPRVEVFAPKVRTAQDAVINPDTPAQLI